MELKGYLNLNIFISVVCVTILNGNVIGGAKTNFTSGFSSIVKHVIKNMTTASPQISNVHGIPLNNSEKWRIIGGIETARNEFPFIVSLARYGKHFCGGAVIDPEWVLTAAHCASEPDFDVTAGEHNLEINEGTEQKSRAILVIRNANYNPITYEDDICLIKVSPPFNYDKHVQPFSVPSTHYVANGDATVAGWGTEDEAFQVVSPVLRKVTIPLVPSLQCASQYGSYFHPLKMICAGEEEGGKDACQGDSGGPLMCDDYHKGATLCGVVSFGLGCARPELAGVYTKTAYYADWVEYQIRMNSGNKGIQPPPTQRTPPPYTRPTTQQTHPNPLDNLPPGYVVIIKPGNSSHVHPPPQIPVTPPYQHRHNRTNNRGRSSSSMISPNKLVQLITIPVSLVLLFIRMR